MSHDAITMFLKCDFLILSFMSFLCNYAVINSSSRPCNWNCKEFSKVCHYTFRIRSIQLENRTFFAINDQIPGPEIHLCIYDYLIVDVINLLNSSEPLSIHWHGLTMINASGMDGVGMLTQCPILSSTNFRYEFQILQSGTFFYHAHSVEQHTNGIFGPIVILEHPYFYNLLTLYPVTNDLVTLNSDRGRGLVKEIRLSSKYPLSLNNRIIKLINAAAIDCPMLITMSGYFIKILKSDGNFVRDTRTKNLLIFPGERIDFVVEKNLQESPVTLSFQVKGLHLCSNLQFEEFIQSRRTVKSVQNLINVTVPNFNGCSSFYESIICSQNLQNDKNLIEFSKKSESTIYLGFKNNKDGETSVTNEHRVMYPSSGMLSRYTRHLCNRSSNQHCVNTLHLNSNQKIAEVVLINLNDYENSGTTFHLHGAQVYILGSGSFATNLSLNWVQFIDKVDQLVRNYYTPPLKDTFYIPDQGYLIFRLITSHPGYWLLESRDFSTKKFEIVLHVGDSNSGLPNIQNCQLRN